MKGEFYRSIFNREEYREIKEIYKSVQSPEIQLVYQYEIDESLVGAFRIRKSTKAFHPQY